MPQRSDSVAQESKRGAEGASGLFAADCDDGRNSNSCESDQQGAVWSSDVFMDSTACLCVSVRRAQHVQFAARAS